MHIIDEHLGFVKSQVMFHERMVLRFKDESNSRRADLHENTARKFKALADYLEALKDTPDVTISTSPSEGRLSLAWDEIQDLPEELLSELSISESDKSEFNIVTLINEAGGVASLDKLLVALYRQSGEIMKRATLNARIYRMVQNKLIYNVPKKKGVYSTHPVSEEDAAKLI